MQKATSYTTTHFFAGIFICLLLVFPLLSIAQPPPMHWQKSYGGSNGESGRCIIQTADGGFMACGSNGSANGDATINHGSSDVWLVKMDALGNLIWQKSYGGSQQDQGMCIVQTTDGGYIFTAQTSSNDGDVTLNHGMVDIWVVKIDATGNILWQKSLGGSLQEQTFSIIQISDGGYVVAGSSISSDGDLIKNFGSNDAWLVKLYPNGNIQWQKSLGGTGSEFAGQVIETSDGGLAIAGSTSSNDVDVSGNHGGSDAWLVKMDAKGTLQWQKCYGGYLNESIFSFQQTIDGGFILAARATTATGDVTGFHGGLTDGWVVKVNSTGTLEWQKCIGGSSGDYIGSVKQTIDGGYILVGSTLSTDGDVLGNHGGNDLWLVKLKNTGSLDWQKCYGGTNDDGGECVIQTVDGDFVVVGNSTSTNGDANVTHNSIDLWAIKLGLVPRVNTVGTFSFCPGSSSSPILFSGNSPGLSYSWYNNNTAIGLASSGTGALPAFMATNNGSSFIMATIKVIASYTSGSTVVTGPETNFIIYVKAGAATPVVSNLASSTLCTGDSATLTIVQPNTLNIYQWFVDGLPISNANDFLVVKNAGTYSVVAILDNCPSAASQPISLLAYSRPIVSFDANMNSQCLNNNLFIFGNNSSLANDALQYHWFFGDGNTSVQNSPSYSYQSATSFVVKLVATSLHQCSDSLSKTVIVHPSPVAVFVVNDTTQCLNENQFATTNQTANLMANSYSWDYGDGRHSTDPYPIISYTSAGQYMIQLQAISNEGCYSFPVSNKVQVMENPFIDFPAVFKIVEGQPILLSPTNVPVNGLSYHWMPNTYLNNDTLPTPISTPTNNIIYYLMATAENGCEALDTVLVKALQKPTIPTAFSPNGDNINDKWEIGFLEDYSGATIEIFNRYGQLVYTIYNYQKKSSWDGTINGKPAPTGTYYYLVNTHSVRGSISGSVTLLR